jgi:hypothetical protein
VRSKTKAVWHWLLAMLATSLRYQIFSIKSALYLW